MTEPEGASGGTGLDPKLAGALCYSLGWLTGIIFLLIEKENKFVKFHAWQSILTFGGLTVLCSLLAVTVVLLVLTPFPMLLGAILWIVLIVKAYQGEKFKLPLIGDIAEKQIN